MHTGFCTTCAQTSRCDPPVGGNSSVLLGFWLHRHVTRMQGSLHRLCSQCHPCPTPAWLLLRWYSVTSLGSGFPSLKWGAASPSGFCEDIGASPHEAIRPRVARGIQQILNQAFIFPLRTAPAPEVDLTWTCFIMFYCF